MNVNKTNLFSFHTLLNCVGYAKTHINNWTSLGSPALRFKLVPQTLLACSIKTKFNF